MEKKRISNVFQIRGFLPPGGRAAVAVFHAIKWVVTEWLLLIRTLRYGNSERFTVEFVAGKQERDQFYPAYSQSVFGWLRKR